MNEVKLGGTAKRIRSGKGATTAWAFGLIEVAGRAGKKATHNVKAFGNPANALAEIAEGSAVELTGHLERQKVQDSDTWETVVVVDRVSTPHGAEDDIPF